jgi:hypothetical protein
MITRWVRRGIIFSWLAFGLLPCCWLYQFLVNATRFWDDDIHLIRGICLYVSIAAFGFVAWCCTEIPITEDKKRKEASHE